MAKSYYFRDGTDRDSPTLLPVGGGPYVISDMSEDYEIGDCFIQFFNAAGNPVTPTAGSIQFEAGVMEGQYLDPPAEATIDATLVVGSGVATYTPPSFNSAVRFSRVSFTGITGATHAMAIHWRANN